MDSRRAITSARSTVIHVVALAPKVTAIVLQSIRHDILAGKHPVGVQTWIAVTCTLASSESRAEAHGVSLTHCIPVTQWESQFSIRRSVSLTELSHLSLWKPPFPRRVPRLAINVLLEEVVLLGCNEHRCIDSCLLESVLIKFLVKANCRLNTLGVLLFECIRKVWMFVSVLGQPI